MDHNVWWVSGSSKYPTTPISWFELPANPLDGGGWQEHVLAEVEVPINAQAIDLDGDIDIVSTRGNSGNYDGVFWLEQVRTTQPVKRFQPARNPESQPMPLPGP